MSIPCITNADTDMRIPKLPNDLDENSISLSFSSLYLEAIAHGCSVKKMFLKIMQFSQENTYARVSLLIKLQAGDTSLYWTVWITKTCRSKTCRNVYFQSASKIFKTCYKNYFFYMSEFLFFLNPTNYHKLGHYKEMKINYNQLIKYRSSRRGLYCKKGRGLQLY